ncbi:hypothetical protein D3C78_1504730 [compost metagenome]
MIERLIGKRECLHRHTKQGCQGDLCIPGFLLVERQLALLIGYKAFLLGQFKGSR